MGACVFWPLKVLSMTEKRIFVMIIRLFTCKLKVCEGGAPAIWMYTVTMMPVTNSYFPKVLLSYLAI